MHRKDVKADYLIVGCGAVGMAFADTLLTETDATIAIIDQGHQPGGHWNYAYPFVTLHQPSQFYGVASLELSQGYKDQHGFNKGLHSLASGARICAYYDEVMQHRFLPSGRVRYFPMCQYESEGRFTSIPSGKQFAIDVGKKTVDATYLTPTIPATHTPNFKIDSAVQCKPLNDLPDLRSRPAGYVVLGGGKTGIDACLWLLDHQVDPDDICWIMPRDAWLLDRANVQPGEEFFERSIGALAVQMEATAQADSITDMFDRLEAGGYFLRIDTAVRPTMFHAATISQDELQALRRIKNIVRQGRVTQIKANEIVLQHGTIATSPQHLHIDCTASALENIHTGANAKARPIFEPGRITPQMVRAYQPIFSAALVAYVEANVETDQEKNKYCAVVPVPNDDVDYVRFTAVAMMNQYHWSTHPGIGQWIESCRLDGFSKLMNRTPNDDPTRQALLGRFRDNLMPAAGKLQQFLAELG